MVLKFLKHIQLNSGVIADSAGNAFNASDAVLTIPGDMEIVLDGDAPRVSAVELVQEDGSVISSNTLLKAGDEFFVRLTLTEGVNLDTSQGGPELLLDIGGSEARAVYQALASPEEVMDDEMVDGGGPGDQEAGEDQGQSNIVVDDFGLIPSTYF